MNLHLLDIKDWGSEPTRKGFGRGLVKAGDDDENVVALCADLTGSVQIAPFAEKYPERFVEVGVAEQNLVTVASGMAAMGKIPFAASYAAFNPGRNWEQIKTTAALNDMPVKVVGAHAGLYTGPDGATHQMLEDIAMMRVMPNMVVVVPGDSVEAEKATIAMAKDKRPGYLRLARDNTPVMTTDKTPFEIGKAYVFSPGQDITIIATGTMTSVALEAAEKLYHDGIDAEVIHCPTIKPLDNATLLASVKRTKRVITIEEAQIAGGLGGAVAELLSEHLPVPVIRMGVKDVYGQSGTPDELFQHYGLTAKHVALQAHHLVDQK
jgi:transketolase